MNFTYGKHKELLIEFVKANVDFILVGGYAIIYYGYVRTTGDMGVWLKSDNENKQKVVQAFSAMGANAGDLRELSKIDFNGIVSFHMGAPPERIDFMTRITGVKFDEAFDRRNFLKLKGYDIPVLNLDDLIANKLLTGRAKDKADVEELKKIGRIRKKGKD